MKHLLENWNRFLNEEESEKRIGDPDFGALKRLKHLDRKSRPNPLPIRPTWALVSKIKVNLKINKRRKFRK